MACNKLHRSFSSCACAFTSLTSISSRAGIVGRHPAPWRTEPRENLQKKLDLLPTLCPPRCWIHISGRPRLPPSIYTMLSVADIASPRHPTHCKAIRQQILQYIKIIKQLYCSSAAWRPHNAEVARAYESGPYLASASSVIFYINILPLKVN